MDIPPCEVAVALPPDPTPAARAFAEIAAATRRVTLGAPATRGDS
jgi:hypothetical protein